MFKPAKLSVVNTKSSRKTSLKTAETWNKIFTRSFAQPTISQHWRQKNEEINR